MSQKNLVRITLEGVEGPLDCYRVSGMQGRPFLVSKELAKTACIAKRLARAVGNSIVPEDRDSAITHEVSFGTKKGEKLTVYLTRHDLSKQLSQYPDIVVIRPGEKRAPSPQRGKHQASSELQPGAA